MFFKIFLIIFCFVFLGIFQYILLFKRNKEKDTCLKTEINTIVLSSKDRMFLRGTKNILNNKISK